MGSINRTEDTEDDTEEQSSGSRYGSFGSDAEGLSVSSRQRIRDQMHADIEAFLARGGKIQQLDITMSAEKLNQH